MSYDINHFVKKYKSIPANMFGEEMNNIDKPDVHCYIGHGNSEEEKYALADILWENLHISSWELVSGQVEQYKFLSLKERIIKALQDIKANNTVLKKPDILDVLIDKYEKEFTTVLEREYISNVI